MRICPDCGHENVGVARDCDACGARLAPVDGSPRVEDGGASREVPAAGGGRSLPPLGRPYDEPPLAPLYPDALPPVAPPSPPRPTHAAPPPGPPGSIPAHVARRIFYSDGVVVVTGESVTMKGRTIPLDGLRTAHVDVQQNGGCGCISATALGGIAVLAIDAGSTLFSFLALAGTGLSIWGAVRMRFVLSLIPHAGLVTELMSGSRTEDMARVARAVNQAIAARDQARSASTPGGGPTHLPPPMP